MHGSDLVAESSAPIQITPQIYSIIILILPQNNKEKLLPKSI